MAFLYNLNHRTLSLGRYLYRATGMGIWGGVNGDNVSHSSKPNLFWSIMYPARCAFGRQC